MIITRFTITSVGRLLILTGCLWLSLAHAQEELNSVTTQPSASNVTKDQLIALIANEVLIAPGIGLRNIRIGEPLDEVQDRLGPPTKITSSGILSKTYTLFYQLDGGTAVALIGRKRVEQIAVSGTSAALVRTVQGARFGMNRNLIQRIYRNPTKSRDDRLEYRNRGVTFYFADNSVSRISVYARGS